MPQLKTDVNLLADRGFPPLPSLGLWLMPSAEVSEVYHYSGHDGLVIPYFDLNGKPVLERDGSAFERVRLQNYTPKKGKYRSRKGSSNHAYLPHLPGIDWTAIAKGLTTLAFVEGEFKAVAGCLAENAIPTIAFAGVSNVLDNGKLLPELMGFNFTGRECLIVYDAPLNPNEVRAALNLASVLQGKGAKPVVLDITKTKTYQEQFQPGSKCGLDDYLHAGGSWVELTHAVFEVDEASSTVGAFLSQIIYYSGDGGDKYINLALRSLGEASPIRKRAAITVDFAPYAIPSATGKGKTSVVDLVLRSKYRQVAEAIATLPHLPYGMVEHEGLAVFNLWQGFDLSPARNDAAVAEIKAFIHSLFSSWNAAAGEVTQSAEQAMIEKYYWQWHAHLARCTGQRLFTSITLKTAEQGVGKSLAFEIHQAYMGARACKIVGPNRLFSQWTSWLEGTYYVIANEPASDAGKHKQQMKEYRTNPTLNINIKSGANYDIPNILAFAATTNESYAWGVDAADRRELIYEPTWLSEASIARLALGPERDAAQHHFDLARRVGSMMGANLVGEDLAARKVWGGALLWHLLECVDVSDFSPTAPAPDTAAKRAVVIASRSIQGASKLAIIEAGKELAEKNGGIVFSVGTLEAWARLHGFNESGDAIKKILGEYFAGRGWTIDSNYLTRLAGQGGKREVSPVRVWGASPLGLKASRGEDRDRFFNALDGLL